MHKSEFILPAVLIIVLIGSSCQKSPEPHLKNIRQLTFGGENAEAYFSSDGRRLIFQSTHDSL
ncbi:MAG: hypothetical protein L0Y74_10410, partial [candidate division Zixibacteria bacterium]|nr:hypothetical protein [candidate division Zixibacteria bacterium]